MTEVQARAALAACVAVGELEVWIAGQPWREAPGGWAVLGELHGWRFQLERATGGVRVVISEAGGEPAVWIVPAAP